MPFISKPSPVTRTAVVYVTVGALTDVWSGIWYLYLRDRHPTSEDAIYWCYGFLLTGLTLVLIGLALGWIARIGRIDRPARYVEVPGEEVDAIFSAGEERELDVRHGEIDKIVPPATPAEPITVKDPILGTVDPTLVSTMVVDVKPSFQSKS